MKLLILAIILGSAFLIRFARWLALVQQKEYRPDRLWLFIKTSEGISDVLRIWPHRTDFSRSGLKRPKLTPRILIVAVTAIALYGLSTVGVYIFQQNQTFGLLIIVLVWLFWYVMAVVLVPAYVFMAVVPSAVIASFRTDRELQAAVAVLAKRHPLIIGITGSYGKSSTKHILAFVLSKRYSVFATPKSFNTRYSVAHSIVTGYQQESVAILEYGAYGHGEIKALADVFIPKIAIITGLAQQHLGLFRTESDIIKAKSELVTAVPGGGSIFYNDANKKTKHIVEAGNTQDKRVVAVSTQSICANWRDPQLSEKGQLFFYWGNKRIDTKLVGLHYLETLQLVAAVADSLDVSQDDIQDGFEQFSPQALFVSSYTLTSGAIVIDDGGTSNPHGFVAALDLVKAISADRRILVTPGIIDLGSQEHVIHKTLATKARAIVDEIWHIGTTGGDAFMSVFKADYHTMEQAAFIAATRQWGVGTVILVEGRMPGWLQQMLSDKKVT